MAIGDQYKLKFVIDADGRTAKQELNALTADINKLGGRMTSTFGGAVPLIGAAAGALAAAGLAAVGLVSTIYRLSQSAADFGGKIYDASVKTGLQAETLTALKHAGDQSNTSFEAISKSVSKFSNLIFDAANGSREAKSQLVLLGLDPQESLNDLDGSLAKVFKKIFDIKNPIERAGLASAAFGKKLGAELIPFIDQFNGDLPGLIKHLTDLGVLMSGKDAQAADEFGDVMQDLNAQLDAVGRTIGIAFLPQFTTMARDMSRFLSENQTQIKTWATDSSDAISGVVDSWRRATNAVIDYTKEVDKTTGVEGSGERLLRLAMFGPNAIYAELAKGLLEKARQRGADLRLAAPLTAGMGGSARGLSYDPDADARKDAADKAKKAADEARRKAEQAAARTLAAQMGGQGLNLGAHQADITESLEQMIRKMREFGTSDKAVAVIAEEFDRLSQNAQIVLADLEALENQQRVNMLEAEQSLLTQRQRIRRDEELARIEKARADFKDGRAKVDAEVAERSQDRFDQEIKQATELLEIERKKAEFYDSLPIASVMGSPEDFGIKQPIVERQITALDALADRYDRLKQSMESVVGMDNVLAGMGNIAIDMFENMTSAVGGAIEQWAMYGGSVMDALQKALAAELAHIAGVATINALYATALGFLRLAQWDLAGAANAFTSAALWGALAGATALGARALSGDQEGQAGAGAGTGQGTGQGNGNQPLTASSRVSENAFVSGRRTHEQMVAAAVEKLAAKIDGVSPGHILVAAAREKRGFIGNQAASDVESNAGIGRKLAGSMGIR